MSASPLVSIVIAAYNAIDTLRETLASVSAQTWRNFELVVVDDGSTDATPAWLAMHAATRPWMRWVQQDNAGVAVARNHAIEIARGEFIAFLDADDLWLPDKLALQMAVFERNPSVALVYADEQDFSPEGDAPLTRFQQKPPDRGRVLPRLFFGNFILNSTVVVRKDALLAVGGFDASHRVHEGIDLWLRLSEHHDFDYVERVLVRYRVRPESLSHTDLLACQRRDLEIMDYWIARRPDLFPENSPRVRLRRARIFERVGRTLFSQQDYAGSRRAYRRAITLGLHDPGLLARACVSHAPITAKFFRFAKAASKSTALAYF